MKQVIISLALILCVIPSAYAKDTTSPQGLSIHSEGFEFMEAPQRGRMKVVPTRLVQIVTGKSSSSRNVRSAGFR